MEQGSLELTLSWDGRQIVAAGIASTRPAAAHALRGMPVARVLEIVPRLFSLCRNAQAAATRLAVAAARGGPASVGPDAALAVGLEAIGEHLWRLLLDWPPLCGQAPRQGEFLLWRSRLQAVDGPAAAAALAGQLTRWLAQEEPFVFAEAMTLDPVALLPEFSASEWAAQLDDEGAADWAAQSSAGFPARSATQFATLAGQPAETGALARHAADAGVAALLAAGRRVSARLAARYAELRWLAQALIELPLLSTRLDAARVGVGGGLARVETARGTLLHRVELDGERVARYLMLAPTDWNFHPQGAFARELCASPAPTRAAALLTAQRLALSLDPCAAYAVEVADA